MAPHIIFLWLLAITVASVLHLFRQKNTTQRKGYNFPPGPKKLPIIGNLHQLGSPLHRCLWSLAQKNGPIMYLQLGRVPSVVVSSAVTAKEALKTHDLDFCTRPAQVSTNMFSYGRLDVTFSPYGEYWRAMRKMYMLELLSANRVQSFRTVREDEISLMVEAISSSSPLPVNLSKLVVTLANNIICRITLSRRCEEGKYGKSRFHRIFEGAQEASARFYVGDFFPTMGWIDRIVGTIHKLEKNFGQFDAFYEEVIQEHLDPKRGKPEQEDLVDVLLRLQTDASHLTRAHIKAVLMDMFFAGTETTSATLVWAMSELMRNPSALNKVQEEVRGSVGTKRMVEEDDLHRLKYLKLVVKETMRLYPPAPLLLPREAMRHCRINGYDILPGTYLFVNAWSIGRDPKSWENPEDFYPDRFIDSSVDFKGRDFELIPFGAGRRMCPGMYFGSLTIELALANLLYVFDWKVPNGMSKEDIDMSEVPGITLKKKAPLNLVATKHDMK